MPRVPTYDSPQVNPTTAGVAAPQVSATSVAGRQMQQIGAELSDGGRSLGNVAMQLQQQLNQTRAQEAANALEAKKAAYRYGSTDANGVRTPGYGEIKDRAVMRVAGPDGKEMPLVEAYGAKLKKDIADIASDLSNDDQRRQFALYAAHSQNEFANETGAHQAQQLAIYGQRVAQEQGVGGANTIASAPDNPAIVQAGLANIYASTNKQLAMQGVISLDQNGKPQFKDDEARQSYDIESKALIAGHFRVIMQSLRDNGQAVAALNFIDAHKDEVSQTDYKQLRGSVLEQANASIAIDAVDKVTAKYWADHSQSPNEEAIDKALRDQFHDDPMMLRAARAEFSSRVGDWTFTHQQQSNDAQQAAMKDIASGKSIAYIQAQPYYSKLLGGDRLQVINAAQNFADNTLNRASGTGYDAVYGFGQYGSPSASLSSMTIGDVAKFQSGVLIPNTKGVIGVYDKDGKPLGTGAVGAYQITYGTLQKYAPQVFGKDWQSITFSPENQDRLGEAIWNDARHGDLHKVWSSLPHNRPGAYAGTSWDQIKGMIAQGESGGIGKTQVNYDANADALLSDPASIGPLTPQNVQRIQDMAGPKYAPKVIAQAQKWERETTRAAIPSSAEMNAVLSGLNIPTGTTKDPKVLALRAQVRASLQGVLMNEAKEGAAITDPTQRQDILQKAAAATVRVYHSGWLGGSNADVPLLTISREDSGTITGSSYESIPAAERNKINAGLRKSLGRQPSKIDVVRAYYQRQGYVIPR